VDKQRDKTYYTGISSVSGKPLTWLKFTSNGEYDCSKCVHSRDSDYCVECCDFGTLFQPKQELLDKIAEEKATFMSNNTSMVQETK